jgi:diguanylate cyclase (GGDEF)-like protein
MQVDAFTILLFGLFIKAMLGALFFVFWLNDRRGAVWYAWWSATFAFGSLSASLFLLRGFGAEFVSVGIGVASLIAAFACCWQGARAFDRRPPLWLPVLVAPGVWLAACLLPNFLDTTSYRVVLSSALLAPLIAMCAVEFWRGRQEPLQSRWPVMVLFATLALFFVSRILLVNVLPFPFGAQPIQPGWMAAFNLIVFFHALMLSVLLVAMSKERLELDQRMKAQTDPLTGALNRRAFVARGTRLVQRHCHESAPLSLLFLDLDHFKSLNDRLGHSGGDDVLMRFVAVVHGNIRPTDFLFRIGGEEFCCLLPHTRADQAHTAAERIRHQFENASVDVAGTPVKSTVSIGIASTETFGYDLDTLMRKADMAVYAAKRQGRNRVMFAVADEFATAAGTHATILDGRMAPAA